MRIAIRSDNPKGKEQCIEFLKDLGVYITENADVIVGDIHNVKNIHLHFDLGVDLLPILEVKKDYILNIDENSKAGGKNE